VPAAHEPAEAGPLAALAAGSLRRGRAPLCPPLSHAARVGRDRAQGVQPFPVAGSAMTCGVTLTGVRSVRLPSNQPGVCRHLPICPESA
jgi:hypothetical protein